MLILFSPDPAGNNLIYTVYYNRAAGVQNLRWTRRQRD
ncbi:Hypothetical protein ACI5QL_02890 [Bacillus velezensis]|uniref:Uncharacterized protein n=1 Tax=Bacillus amyloliquefaciens (strain Y2) TaxID=1155777 RepID=I2C8N6_BACAY|nr:hypothetical protein MUS_3123 [Bacillus velezensis YAU B9601-Y2]RUS07932.1 hypothetical protein EFW58_00680 [Bacillus velezensis]